MTNQAFSRHRTSSIVCIALGGIALGLVAVSWAGCTQKECSSNADCASGYVCVYNERCEPDPLDGQNRIDAGADAGAADAGAADAGVDGGIQGPVSCGSGIDVFQADDVYLFGTLGTGDCTSRAVAPLDDPDDESVGFVCGTTIKSAVIRPSDGRLIYRDGASDQILIFAKDEHVPDANQTSCTYPSDPAANDTPIPTDACDAAGGATAFLVAPDDEAIWYACSSGWYDGNHIQVEGSLNRELLARGYGGVVLAAPGGDAGELESPSDLLLLDSGIDVPINGLPGEGRLLAWRTLDIGFRIAVQGLDGDDDDDDQSGDLQLWTVSAAGEATQDGVFPGMPANVVFNPAGSFALDSDGALYASAFDRRDGSNKHAVVKLTPGMIGTGELVYTEAESPKVLMAQESLSSLVTGP